MNRFTGPLFDLILVTAIVAAIAYLLGVFGPSLDERDSASSRDAQTQAQRDTRRDLAAAALCREQHGETGFTWTAAGELVCIPRHGKKVLASNP